jgi:hypothetical protein
MASEINRRFSLDDSSIDPALKNRIMSADGEEEAGSWDGESIDDLVAELDRIEETMDPNYAGLPHNFNIPEYLRNQVEKDYPIWSADKSGKCLVGEHANKIVDVDEIREHYQKKYGGVDKFKEKLKRDRDKMIQELKDK